MSFQDHLKTCSYCRDSQSKKVEVSVKSGSGYYKDKKLSELAAIIKGTSRTCLDTSLQTKGASGANITKDIFGNSPKPGYLERQFKLKELGKMIKS
jgi:hypothetical protein